MFPLTCVFSYSPGENLTYFSQNRGFFFQFLIEKRFNIPSPKHGSGTVFSWRYEKLRLTRTLLDPRRQISLPRAWKIGHNVEAGRIEHLQTHKFKKTTIQYCNCTGQKYTVTLLLEKPYCIFFPVRAKRERFFRFCNFF